MAHVDKDLDEVFVLPGECQFVKGPAVIRTLLGSCVGIVFWVPEKQMGALCHPMLPSCPVKTQTLDDHPQGWKYVDAAVHRMTRKFNELRIPRNKVIVKLFGGADVLEVSAHSVKDTVGRMNCIAALHCVEEAGYHLVAQRLGGTSGLHIHFNTKTGVVYVRKLN